MSAIEKGGGVKNWSILPTDSTKKLPTWGKEVEKTPEKLPMSLWIVPCKKSIQHLDLT